DLCGHATLASAHVLWESGTVEPRATIGFHTRSGRLAAARKNGWIELDFPAKPEQRATAPPGLVEALGVEPVYLGRNAFDYLAEVACEDAVRAVRPDFTKLAQVEARGVIVTSRAGSGDYDFVSRFFAPRAGW